MTVEKNEPPVRRSSEEVGDTGGNGRDFPAHFTGYAEIDENAESAVGIDGDQGHVRGVRKRYDERMKGLAISSLVHFKDEDATVALNDDGELLGRQDLTAPAWWVLESQRTSCHRMQ